MSVSPNNFTGPISTTNPWISFPAPKPQARARLFCLPYGGGTTATYFSWSKYLPADIELCPIRLPGRESRLKERPFSSLDPLVDELASALLPYLNKPFAIFGHSMGALISFELLKRLEGRYSSASTHLFVSSRRAAHLPDPDPPVHQLKDSDLVAAVQSRYNGIPQVVLQNEDLLQLLLPMLRADFTLLGTYQYQGGKLACPITAFGGQQDSQVTQADLAAWRGLTSSSFRLRIFQGGHFYLQNAQSALLQAIVSDLAQLTG